MEFNFDSSQLRGGEARKRKERSKFATEKRSFCICLGFSGKVSVEILRKIFYTLIKDDFIIRVFGSALVGLIRDNFEPYCEVTINYNPIRAQQEQEY